MSEVKIAPIPDLGQRTDEITIYAGPCSVESAEQFDEVAECIADLGLHLDPRRRVQAPHQPALVPGPRRGGAQDHEERRRPLQPEDADRGDGFGPLPAGGRLRGRPAGGRPQLPELQPAEEDRRGDGRHPPDGAVQARLRRHYRRVARRHRLHHRSRQRPTWCSASAASAPSRRPRASRWTSRRCRSSTSSRCTRCASTCRIRPASATWCRRLAKAAVAAGADSLMIEVHPNPPVALSDGPQQLTPAQFRELVAELRELAARPGQEDRLRRFDRLLEWKRPPFRVEGGRFVLRGSTWAERIERARRATCLCELRDGPSEPPCGPRGAACESRRPTSRAEPPRVPPPRSPRRRPSGR